VGGAALHGISGRAAARSALLSLVCAIRAACTSSAHCSLHDPQARVIEAVRNIRLV